MQALAREVPVVAASQRAVAPPHFPLSMNFDKGILELGA